MCDWHGETVYATDGSTIGQNARLRLLPDSNTAVVMLTNGGPRESFHHKVFNEILTDLGTVTIPDPPAPDATLNLDLSRYEGVYERPGTRYELSAEGGKPYLTLVLDPTQAEFLDKPDRIRATVIHAVRFAASTRPGFRAVRAPDPRVPGPPHGCSTPVCR
ncbi:hypothetical protein [Streptomyces malaysiensis]|uniref:hypothetical protein n=1 Tax=Streptomyces malaysiensis TaxID=92644 RepID=UPI002B2E9E38|nr:hypothetical protein R8789_03940 [Streptomyces malaysiensis]